MTFASHDNILVTPSGGELSFAHNIRSVVEDDDQCYVIVDAPEGVVFNDNVFCVGLDGAVRWQVENKLKGDEFAFYTGAVVREEELFLFNFGGFTVLVDRDNGRVQEFRFDKGMEATW